MKRFWQQIESRLDGLSLRERAMAFAVTVLVLITLINTVLLDPLLAQQRRLSGQIRTEQQQVAALQAEIQARVIAHSQDPDEPNRERLKRLKQQTAKMHGDLVGMQSGLVSPDKMSALLEDLLKRNGKLHLASLKTLPVTTVNEPLQLDAGTGADKPATGTAPSQKDKAVSKPTGDVVYKHGVEIVVQGEYLDLMRYLKQLEAMPWQLFWARANLKADAYPKTELTLVLFTLSLDRKWLNI
jgi:MSHA biogenesis protein MshJ